jgi:hypothetical protein
LRGHGVRCDESGATGESDAIKKFTYEECIEERDGLKAGGKLKRDCFLISGAKVLEGVGEYLVISVGSNSFNGRIMMGESLRPDDHGSTLIRLNSDERRYRGNTFTNQVESPCRAHCKMRFNRWTYLVCLLDDQVLCSAQTRP